MTFKAIEISVCWWLSRDSSLEGETQSFTATYISCFVADFWHNMGLK